MANLGFYYNMNTCLGCASCQVACKEKHHLLPGEYMRRVSQLDFGPISLACNHCEDALCVKACPTGAMYKSEDGLTLHDDGKCIGCGACTWNCPYGAAHISKATGFSTKCDSCLDLRGEGLRPACVAACPTASLMFGDMDEFREVFESPANRFVKDVPGLPCSNLTKPNILIKPSKKNKEGKNE